MDKEGHLQIWTKEKLPSKIQWNKVEQLPKKNYTGEKKEEIVRDIKGVL